MITQDLWQSHYQTLLIILLKKFIKLNENTNMILACAKHVELNTLSEETFEKESIANFPNLEHLRESLIP